MKSLHAFPWSPWRLLLAAVLLLPGLAAPAAGQEPEDTAAPAEASAEASVTTEEAPADSFGEEIVVTARRREEKVQSTPVSVTAFSDVALEERSMRNLEDLSDFTPNLDFSTSGGFGDQSSEAAVSIRGVGQLDTAVFSDPAVAIYLDGVYLARAQGAVLDLLDLERVEVLRGPQGTLFGKNTTGGAISVITRKPGTERAGSAALTLGSFDRREGRATIDLPLGAATRSSLSLFSTREDGYSRSRATGEKLNDDGRTAGRLAISSALGESATLDWTADWTRERESGSNQVLLALVDTPLLSFYNGALLGAGRPAWDGRWITGDLFAGYSTFPAYYDGDVYGTALSLGWGSPHLGLRSITAYRGFEYSTSSDGDSSPLAAAQRTVEQEQYQVSQELQLSGQGMDDRLVWLSGVLWFREEPRERSRTGIFADLFDALEAAPGPVYAPPGVPDILCAGGAPPPGLPCFGGRGNPLNLLWYSGFGNREILDLTTESWAVFGEGTWSATPRVSLTGGLRYSRDEKRFDYLAISGLGAVTSDLHAEDAWDDWTPRVSLAFQQSPDLLLYTSVSRGFKSGGFNGRPQQRQVLDPFEPETVLAYEAGAKSQLFGRKLTLNGAVFYSDYKDIQFAASLDVGGQPVFVTRNAGRGKIRGFEIEATAQPASGFVLTAGLGHIDTELTELDPGVPAGLSEGGELPKTPEWTASASVQKTFTLATHGALIARADGSWRSDYFNDIANSPGIAQEAYSLVNARLLWALPSGRWEVALFGTNLTDEEYLSHGFFAAAFGANLGLAGRPRAWGATLLVRL